MKSAAPKPARSHSATRSRSRGFFGPAKTDSFFSPVLRKARPSNDIQTKLSVSKPADPLEKQADRTADQVMRMPDPVPRVTSPDPAGQAAAPAPAPPQAQRTATPERVQRFGEGTPSVAAEAKAEIQHAATGGQSSVERRALVHAAAPGRRPQRRSRALR